MKNHVMAPRTARTAPETHVLKMNGHLSSATLASRIAGQLATSRQKPSNQDREIFESLLQEILEDDDNPRQTDAENGDSSVVNGRLICVIVQAGLGAPPLRSSDKERQRRLADVARSLRAIDSIVSRCPAAIFQFSDGAVAEFTRGLPLFAWLIPKLLVEIRDVEFEDREQDVLRILQKMVLSEQRKEARLGPRQISSFFCACVEGKFHVFPTESDELTFYDFYEDLLSSIEATDVGTDGNFEPWCLSSKLSRKIFPSHCAIGESYRPIEVFPRSVPQAFMIVVILLSALLPDPDSIHKGHSSDRLLAQLEKTLGGLKRSWTAMKARLYFTARAPDACLHAHLRCVRLLFLCFLNTSVDPKNVTKTGIFLSQILSFALSKDAPYSNPSIESEVCAALFNLLSVSQQSKYTLHIYTEPLLSEWSKLAPQGIFTAFSQGSQVTRYPIALHHRLTVVEECSIINISSLEHRRWSI